MTKPTLDQAIDDMIDTFPQACFRMYNKFMGAGFNREDAIDMTKRFYILLLDCKKSEIW